MAENVSKTSKAQMRASRKYDEKTYDRITIRVKKGDRAKFNDMAKANGTTINAMVNEYLYTTFGM